MKSRLKRFFAPILLLGLVSALPGIALSEEEPTAKQLAAAIPEDSLDRGTPRRSVIAFLSAGDAQDFTLAAEYLDMRYLPKSLTVIDSAGLAHDLTVILRRALWVDIEEFSDDPGGMWVMGCRTTVITWGY